MQITLMNICIRLNHYIYIYIRIRFRYIKLRNIYLGDQSISRIRYVTLTDYNILLKITVDSLNRGLGSSSSILLDHFTRCLDGC